MANVKYKRVLTELPIAISGVTGLTASLSAKDSALNSRTLPSSEVVKPISPTKVALGYRILNFVFGFGNPHRSDAGITDTGLFYSDRFLRIARNEGSIMQPWKSQVAHRTDGVLIGSPSIARGPDNALYFSYDNVSTPPTTVVMRSDDEGQTWSQVASGIGAGWATLFLFSGKLYLLGTSAYDSGHIVLFECADNGVTWGSAIILLNFSTAVNTTRDGTHIPGYHCAPTPVLAASNGKLYKAFEDGTVNDKLSFVMQYNGGGITTPANWVPSNKLTWSTSWQTDNVWKYATSPSGNGQWLEGNCYEIPGTGIRNQLRVTNPNDIAAVTTVDGSGSTPVVAFDRLIRFEGGHGKFHIQYDTDSKNLIALSNPLRASANASGGGSRNHLALFWSSDGYIWNFGVDVAGDRLYHNNLTLSQQRSGFQYPSFLLSGLDLHCAVRTSYLDSPATTNGFHDSKRMTYHFVRDFRDFVGGW